MKSRPCCDSIIIEKENRALFWISLLYGFLLAIFLFIIFKKPKNSKIPPRIKSSKINKSENEFDTERLVFNKVASDDLTIISGIGPVISDFLISQGISTFEKLSSMQTVDLKNLLMQRNLRLNNAETWPLQAKFAYLNQWQALKSYKKEINSPRDNFE